MPLLLLAFELAALRQQVVHLATAELPVGPMLRDVGRHVEVHRTVGFVAQAIVDDLLHHLDLFRDMPRGPRLDGRRQAIEAAQHIVEANGVLLGDLHRLQLLRTGALRHAVLAIVEEVPDVGDVAHVAHAVAEEKQGPVDDVEAHEGAAVAEVRGAVDGRSADVHPDKAGVERFEVDLLAAEGVVELEGGHGGEGTGGARYC